MSTIMFFIMDNVSEKSNFHEDLAHSGEVLIGKGSGKYAKTAVVLFIWHTLLVGLVNYSSTVVTKRLSSVHNAIFSELRIFIVWIVEFILAIIYNKEHGVAFHPLYLVEIIGFAIIVLSAFVYSGKYMIPFTNALYPQDHPLIIAHNEAAERKAASAGQIATNQTASPSTSSEKVNVF